MSNEDNIVQIQTPVNPVSQPETVPPITAPSAEGLVASHQEFRPPEGLEIMESKLTTNLSGVSGTGAQDHPPLRVSVDGSKVKLPEWIGDSDSAKEQSKGSAESGPADFARAAKRQLERLDRAA